MISSLLIGFALMLVLEGVLPFLAPATWRETFRRLIQLGGNNRFAAGVSKMSLLAILEKD